MNNLTPGEEFLKEQVGSFEYPYDGASWLIMEKTLRRKSFTNFLKWASGFAVFTAAVITTIYILPENQDNKTTMSSGQNTNIQVTKNNTPVTDNNTTPQNNNYTAVTNNNISHSGNNTPVNNEITNTVVYVVSDSSQTIINNDNLLTRTHSKSPCPDFTMSETSGCPPLSVQFIPAEKCDSMIYSWDFGDGKISTEKQPVHNFSKSGKYTVRLMVKYFRSDEMKTRIIENAIVINPKPKSSFDINVDKNTVYLQTSSQENNLTWIANDTVTSGNTAERVYMKNGKYPVTLIVQNSYGCADTLTKKAEIDVPLVVFMPNAFTPFNEGPNKVFCPFSDNSAIINYQMEIINSMGQLVFCKKGKNVDWDGINQQSNQPCESGTYHYKLKIWDKFGNFEQLNGNVNIK